LLPMQRAATACVQRSRILAGWVDARHPSRSLPGMHDDHEPEDFASQNEGGGRRFNGFNATRGFAPKRDANAQLQ
jgi:hypothetical protein